MVSKSISHTAISQNASTAANESVQFFFNKEDLKHIHKSKGFIPICIKDAGLVQMALCQLGYNALLLRTYNDLRKQLGADQANTSFLIGAEAIGSSEIRLRSWNKKLLNWLNDQSLDVIPISVHEVKSKKISSDFVPINDLLLSRNRKRYLLRIGEGISASERREMMEQQTSLRKYLKAVFYCMGSGLSPRTFFKAQIQSQKHAIGKPIQPEHIASELADLPKENFLFRTGDFELYTATARQIPNTLNEIGRLRELTFRAVGEGSDKAYDLDLYDLYYEQLIIWDAKANKIVGGYRMGNGKRIWQSHGMKGFYCSSLFRIKKEFGKYLLESLELGRSYVVQEYQRHRMPLFLLWRAIFHYLQKNPDLRYLLGPVSISKYYSDVSKQLIIAFVKQHCYDPDLAAMVKARKEFRFKRRLQEDVILGPMQGKLEKLDDFIKNIEPSHFKMPVLIKKYLKLNARIIAFNIDPKFNDALDGFIFLDLHSVPAEVLDALKNS